MSNEKNSNLFIPIGMTEEQREKAKRDEKEGEERMTESKSSLSSETTNELWKNWSDYLKHKRIKQATIQVFFYYRGWQRGVEIRSWREFASLQGAIQGIQEELIINQDKIGTIWITSGPDLEEVSTLVNMADHGYPDRSEHIMMYGNKFQEEEGMKPEVQARRQLVRDQRIKDGEIDPD